MTIDEAIAHARKTAEIQRKICETHIFFGNLTYEEFYADDTEIIEEALYEHKLCAEEHEQIAEWLEELKALRETTFDYTQLFDARYEQGRADAIDEFQNWLKTQIVGIDGLSKEILVVKNDKWDLACDVYLEQLKEQK